MTPGRRLSEGIANNAILMAHRCDRGGRDPDPDLRLGLLLALLQDDAKNQASWLTWKVRGGRRRRIAPCCGATYLVRPSGPTSLRRRGATPHGRM